ncbi:DUF1592 domain-containing protein [Myxococcaceae bacterium GXIMD 01537]
MSRRAHARGGELALRTLLAVAVGGVLATASCDGSSVQRGPVRPPGPEEPPPVGGPPDPGGGPNTPEGCPESTDPGRVTLHRLNRAEYDNTVRELLGDTTRPARGFPADDHGFGFDNNADVLSMSPLLMEKYATAAEALVEEGWTRGTVRTCALDAADPMPCAREVLSRFARRAWRRPVSDSEVQRLLGFVSLAQQHGDAPEVGVKLALRAVLTSPYFLFRVELDPEPASTKSHPLTGYELASRLSYFLWSAPPDEELMAKAEAGVLNAPEELEAQVRRMLADPRSQALVDNFAGQWLYLRALDVAQPDATLYPDFNEALRTAMLQESQLVFLEFLHGDHPVRDLMDAPFTYVNDPLARHYGLPPPGSATPKRVDLSGAPDRVGLLGQGAILTVTSHSDRTSPVKRGLWVLEQFLCKAPPPPPPDVMGLPPPINPNASIRERMEAHRSRPTCAGCHAMMDPIGFGLENYDPIGRWRVKEEVSGAAVDASGQLPDGQTFQNIGELRAILKKDPDLSACVSEHLLTYALGRGMSEVDACAVHAIARRAEARGGRLRDFIEVLVQSEPFTHRRGEAAGGGTP